MVVLLVNLGLSKFGAIGALRRNIPFVCVVLGPIELCLPRGITHLMKTC